MEYMHLIGAEDVLNSGAAIARAAEAIRAAANHLDEVVTRLERALDEHATRFERAMSDAGRR